ncbi:MAG TPA: hypothetical protein VFF27_03540 [Bacteroidia bacterium]|jgi:hypothetical protein|nr:hypothetical protein [Bacteroidia bacterium]
MLYPKEVIDITTEWIKGDSRAGQWLQENNLTELFMLKDAVSRHAKPMQYLLVNKHIILAAFVNAIWEDQAAFKLLMTKGNHHWAAMANYINGDEKAALFLKNNKLQHYAELAHQILEKIRKEGDEGSNIFNSGPYKVER